MKRPRQAPPDTEGFYATFGITVFLALVGAFIVLRPLTTRTIAVEDEHKLPADSAALTQAASPKGGTVLRGEDVEIPPNFPSDVPVYPGAKVGAVTQVTEADASSLLLTTQDDIAAVAGWYEVNAGNGWTLDDTERGMVREIRRFGKPGYRLVVTAEFKEGRTETTVVKTKKEEVK